MCHARRKSATPQRHDGAHPHAHRHYSNRDKHGGHDTTSAAAESAAAAAFALAIGVERHAGLARYLKVDRTPVCSRRQAAAGGGGRGGGRGGGCGGGRGGGGAAAAAAPAAPVSGATLGACGVRPADLGAHLGIPPHRGKCCVRVGCGGGIARFRRHIPTAISPRGRCYAARLHTRSEAAQAICSIALVVQRTLVSGGHSILCGAELFWMACAAAWRLFRSVQRQRIFAPRAEQHPIFQWTIFGPFVWFGTVKVEALFARRSMGAQVVVAALLVVE